MEELLKQLTELKKRAADKIGEIKDDTAPEVARTIKDEHSAILADIKKLEGEISDKRSQQTHVTANPEANSRAADIVGIAAMARAAGVEVSTEDELNAIRGSGSVSDFRADMQRRLAARSADVQTHPARVIVDEREVRRSAMSEALSYGLGAVMPASGPSDAAKSFMGRGIIDMAAQTIEWKGSISPNARQKDEILTRAAGLSTSDFPIIFENAVNRTLESRYALAQPTYRRIARKRNFATFRPETAVKVGDFPMLEKVLENGEIKYGSFTESKETVQAFSYAIALSISRQMLINDDLGAIEELLSDYGPTVALFEEVTFYTLAFNANLSDGFPVFHANHGNLAGAGTVIDVTNVGKARAAMSKQKSVGGNQLLNNSAKIMLVGPDKLTEAEMLVASITPATVSSVNIFSGKMDVLDSAQIAGNMWHTFADPSLGSNYRWGYLDGFEGPRVRYDEPFGRQGFSMSVELDFGVGATDFRYGYRNPGA